MWLDEKSKMVHFTLDLDGMRNQKFANGWEIYMVFYMAKTWILFDDLTYITLVQSKWSGPNAKLGGVANQLYSHNGNLNLYMHYDPST